ncbi:MAG: hypothetical protein ACREMN_05950 [Gemmatimonadales bacterium]
MRSPASRPEGRAGAHDDADPFAAIEAKAAAQWHPDAAAVARAIVAEARAAWETWWNAPLTFDEARAWGGYSASQLRRDVQAGRVPATPDGRVRRRDVPVKPGHRLPLDAEPAPTGAGDWTAQLIERRQHRRI